MSNIPRLHHYVPQSTLRRFAFGPNDQVFAFDKLTQKILPPTSVRNFAAEKDFYAFLREDVIINAEPLFSDIEERASAVIRRVVAKESLSGMTDEQRHTLDIFVALQFSRTKSLRDMMTIMRAQLREWASKVVGDLENKETWLDEQIGPSLDANGEKQDHLQFSMKLIPDIVAIIKSKKAVLFYADSSQFWIGDNPVVMQNYSNRDEFLGNIGFGVEGVEIYLPVSPSLTIGYLCSSTLQNIRSKYLDLLLARTVCIDLDQRFSEQIREIEEKYSVKNQKDRIQKGLYFSDSIESGEKIGCTSDNILNLNSLQLLYASRFVFSRNNCFEDAIRMIKENPSYKKTIHFGMYP